MQTALIICLVVFLIILILLEKVHSIKILIRLILSLALMYAYIRAIANGNSVVLSSILLSFLLAVINIFIKNGVHKESFSELVSVLITSLITSEIIFVICKTTNIKIYKNAIMSFNGVKNSANAMFGIYMIATLGIFMDIVSRIIFCLNEQKDKKIDTPWKEQFFKGIEFGRKYISEKINMIVLILLSVSLFSISEVINKEKNFFEICDNPIIYAYCLIAVVANIGLVISVPITACIYSCFNRKKTIYKTVSDNKVDGKRSLKL